MSRLVLALSCLIPLAAAAEMPSCAGGQAGCAASPPPAMMHATMMHGAMAPGAAGAPLQAGQAAFAAIQEIVGLLEADPATDWSKVDIDALRQHLVDMNEVTLAARVDSRPVDGGIAFSITGEGPVAAAIRRMVAAHAAAMDGAGGWRLDAAEIDGGARLTVRVPPPDLAKLRGLGFFGLITRGMHHQQHHLMLARGGSPHP